MMSLAFFPLGGDRILWFHMSYDVTWWWFLRQYNAIQHHGLEAKCNLYDAITLREMYWLNHYTWGFTVYAAVVLEYCLLKGLILFIYYFLLVYFFISIIILSVYILDVQFMIFTFSSSGVIYSKQLLKKNLPVLHDGNMWRNSPRPRPRQSSVT